MAVKKTERKFCSFINLWILLTIILLWYCFTRIPVYLSYETRDCQVGCCPFKLPFKSKASYEIELSNTHQETIVQKHNQFRNKLAVGKVPGLKPAVRMATIMWDEDLANMAKLSSQHSSPHCDRTGSTAQYPFIGQNVAFSKGVSENFLNPTDYDMHKLIDLWLSEYLKANQKLINAYNVKMARKIQNLSNILYESTTKVGCGMTAYFDSSEKLMYIFICNYDFRPSPDQPIYASGPSCSKCTTGCNPMFTGLCNPSEYFDIR